MREESEDKIVGVKENIMKRKIKPILVLLILMIASIAIGTNTVQAKAIKISEKNKMVVMRVSYATSEFDESWGGVMCAVPKKDTDVYTMYDVVIWNDRISLYKFKGNIEDEWLNYLEKNGSVQMPEDKYNALYRKFRESYLLKEVKCKNLENNVSLNSKKRLSAYKSFFKIINKKTPSENVMIKYSGHGGGVQFCHSLTEKDTKAVLKDGIKTFGRKFAIIDYGTNCRSGMSSVLNYYQNYTDYMVVSQNDYGGFTYDNWTIGKFQKVDTDYLYPNMFKKGETTEKAVRRLAKQHILEWPMVKKSMKKNNLPQSVTVVKMKNYKAFISSLKKSKKSNVSYEDLKKQAGKYGGKKLLKKYNKAVIYYKNNGSYLKGKWKYGTGITCDQNI